MRGSENREKVYNFIQDYWKENASCPTVREICTATEIRSTSTVHGIIHRLIDDKRLQSFDFGQTRKCTPMVECSNIVKYCPFCGNSNCYLIELKEYRCANCNTTFIVVRKD